VTSRRFWRLLADTIVAYVEGDHALFGAAIAFYTVIALAPLILVVVGLAAPVFGETATRAEILGRVQHAAGSGAAQLVGGIIDGLRQHPLSGWHLVFGGALGFYLTTRLFTQTQVALNHLWGVPMPKAPIGATLRMFGLHRLYATLMLLAIGLLTLIALAVPAILLALRRLVGIRLPGVLDYLVQHGATTLLLAIFIAALYKLLPNARIAWRDAFVGAAATAVLLAIAQLGIAAYFAHGDPEAGYGAGGALLVLLLWIYYSAQVFFVGAQLTLLYAQRYGAGIQPRRTRPTEHDEAL
jgi:membrane protein